MIDARLTSILEDGEHQYRQLLSESTGLLQRFDQLASDDMDAVDERRREIMGLIQNFDKALSDYILEKGAGLTKDARERIDGFYELREHLTGKILELDGVVIAFARERLSALQENLSVLAKGKTALKGYGKEHLTGSGQFDQRF